MATIVDSLIIQLGLDPSDLKSKLKDVEKTAETTDKKFETLGSKWVGGIQGIVARLVAPITGALAISKMISSYTSSVAEVARMTGAYSDKLEQWRYKRAMLARITKEDIDLYVKCREGVVKFNIALADLSAKIAREFSPVVKLGVEWLNKVSSWVDRNSHNIIRFLEVTAGVLTAIFLPALIQIAAALWANPFTWLVAALAGLILVIDDLVVYMQGGKTALSSFWAMFGTGAEIAEKLGGVIEWLTTGFKAVLPAILAVIGTIAGLKTLAAAGSLLVTTFKALFTLLRFNPFTLLITAAWLLYSNWEEICTGAKMLFSDLGGIISTVSDKVVSYIGDVTDGAKMLYGDISQLLGDIVQGFLSLKASTIRAWGAIVDALTKAKNVIITAWSHVKSTIEGAFSAIGSTATRTWNAIVDALLRAKNVIIGTWDEVKGTVGGFFDAISAKAEKLAHPIDLMANFLGFGDDNQKTKPEALNVNQSATPKNTNVNQTSVNTGNTLTKDITARSSTDVFSEKITGAANILQGALWLADTLKKAVGVKPVVDVTTTDTDEEPKNENGLAEALKRALNVKPTIAVSVTAPKGEEEPKNENGLAEALKRALNVKPTIAVSVTAPKGEEEPKTENGLAETLKRALSVKPTIAVSVTAPKGEEEPTPPKNPNVNGVFDAVKNSVQRLQGTLFSQSKTPTEPKGVSLDNQDAKLSKVFNNLIKAQIPAVSNVSTNSTSIVNDNRSTTVNSSPVINVNGTGDPVGTAKIVFNTARRSALALPADSGIQM